jgi:hypothetical protein
MVTLQVGKGNSYLQVGKENPGRWEIGSSEGRKRKNAGKGRGQEKGIQLQEKGNSEDGKRKCDG